MMIVVLEGVPVSVVESLVVPRSVCANRAVVPVFSFRMALAMFNKCCRLGAQRSSTDDAGKEEGGWIQGKNS